MKKFLSLISLGLLILAASSAKAAIQFDAVHQFQVFDDDRWEGSDRHFGFLFDIGADTQGGFFFEEGSWDWKGDIGEAVPNFLHTTAHLNGIRITRKLHRFFSAGIDFGTMQLTVRTAGGTSAGVAGAATTVNQTKPFADVLGRVHLLKKSAGKVSAGLNADVLYRWVDINDVGALGPAGEATLDDLNALVIGLGVFLGF